MQPKEIACEQHREYYAQGGYDDDRLRWTVSTFLPNCKGRRILEIGCGDGKLCSLLQPQNEVYGLDASETGVEKCRARGLPASCLDVSSEPIPFESDAFDVVIILETLEHLMNPYYAMQEIRRVLREGGTLVCSVPNPRTGHLYLYPGLFQFKNFRSFVEQCGFRVARIEPWQWAPRETILPRALRGVSVLRSRYVAGVARRVVEKAWRVAGRFPAFCYWLWTFECLNESKNKTTILEQQSAQTKPKGS